MDNTNQPNGSTSIGAIIGIIIVVVVLVIGAVYIFGSQAKKIIQTENQQTATTTSEIVTDEANILDIQNDLDDIDVKTLDIDEKSI